VKPSQPLEIRLRRARSQSLLRVCLESEEIFRLPPDRSEWTVQIGDRLHENYGFADLVVEEESSAEPGNWSRVLSLTLQVEADPEFRRLHDALVAEIEEVHLSLARDVVSRTWHRERASRDVRVVSAEEDLRTLERVYSRLEHALERIGEQPSRSLWRTRVLSSWRPGDAVRSLALQRLAADGQLQRDASGRVLPPQKLLVDRPHLNTDIEEHRQLRTALLRLAERSSSLSRYCERAVLLLEEEESRWAEDAVARRFQPRVTALERIRADADLLSGRFRRLLARLPFLADVGSPRRALGPTPIFLGRPAYREAYRALLEARQHVGGRLDTEGLRVRFRNLAVLFEYWLFIAVVGLLREACGSPEGNRTFTLIDEVYRPELAPGQEFVFSLGRGVTLVAAYEPEFPPVGPRSQYRFRSALTSGSLRPDVTIELRRPNRPAVILALDAKSGPRFRRALESIEEIARYVWLIHDPRTGHQPVRQLFVVHRDLAASSVSNLSGYLEGRLSAPESRILGAVPAQPGATDGLRNVILRFLDTNRVRRPPRREEAGRTARA
jgi:hypothetical protein